MNVSFGNVDECSHSRASKIRGYVASVPVIVLGALIDAKVNEDISGYKKVLGDEAPTEKHLDPFSEADRRDLSLRKQNVKGLRSIQKIIGEEEDLEISLDETMARVLFFYGRFVPYGGIG